MPPVLNRRRAISSRFDIDVYIVVQKAEYIITGVGRFGAKEGGTAEINHRKKKYRRMF